MQIVSASTATDVLTFVLADAFEVTNNVLACWLKAFGYKNTMPAASAWTPNSLGQAFWLQKQASPTEKHAQAYLQSARLRYQNQIP